jgi:hypothetical protein
MMELFFFSIKLNTNFVNNAGINMAPTIDKRIKMSAKVYWEVDNQKK